MEAIINNRKLALNLVKVGAITSLGLIVYFLIMHLLKLHTIVELRFLNFFIMLIGIRYALIQQRMVEGGKLLYLQGMGLGFMTGLTAAGFFAAFLYIYLKIDGSFMNYIATTQPLGIYLTPASTAMETMMEGSASSLIISFLLINVLNKDNDAG